MLQKNVLPIKATARSRQEAKCSAYGFFLLGLFFDTEHYYI
jgi:hypothetical protein